MTTKKTTTRKKTTKKVTKKATTKKVAKKSTAKIGRPTKYDPAFCEIAIEAMQKGFSKEAVSGHLGICKDTLYQWEKKHKDFSDALKKGLELSRQFWEKIALDHLTHSKGSKQLNSTVWLFNMKNRFGWADKIETKNEDTTNKPKRTFAFSLDEAPASDDE